MMKTINFKLADKIIPKNFILMSICCDCGNEVITCRCMNCGTIRSDKPFCCDETLIPTQCSNCGECLIEFKGNYYEGELDEIFGNKANQYIQLMGENNFNYYSNSIKPQIGKARDLWFGAFGEFYSVNKILKICDSNNIIERIPESRVSGERTPDFKLNDNLAIIEVYTPKYLDSYDFKKDIDIDLMLRNPIKNFMEGNKRKIDQLTTYSDTQLFSKKIGWVNTVFFKFQPFGLSCPLGVNIWTDFFGNEFDAILESIYDCHIKNKLDQDSFILLGLPNLVAGMDIDHFIKFDVNGFKILRPEEVKDEILKCSNYNEDEHND